MSLGRITLRITRWPTSTVDPASYTTPRDVNPARLAEELLISGIAVTALWTLRQRALGIALAVTSAAHHVTVYATGGRLLEG